MEKAKLAAEEEHLGKVREKARHQAKAQAHLRALDRTMTRARKEALERTTTLMGSDLNEERRNADQDNELPMKKTTTSHHKDQPTIRLTQSIKFVASEQASMQLRKEFNQQRDSLQRRPSFGSGGEIELSPFERVRDKYIACCNRWSAKPNSQVLATLRSAVPVLGADGVEISYNFENAHLGDRGGVCLLHALALDLRLVSLCLRGCCLRGGCGPVLAVFIEMHPKLRDIDLSLNSLSFEFGELLLDALDRRARIMPTLPRNKIAVQAPMQTTKAPGSRCSVTSPVMVQSLTPTRAPNFDVNVNLEGTWFTWDYTAGHTVGPPCGTLWAGLKDNRSKLTPSGYEKLRDKLEKTQLIQYHPITEKPEPDYKPQLLLGISAPANDAEAARRRVTALPTSAAARRGGQGGQVDPKAGLMANVNPMLRPLGPPKASGLQPSKPQVGLIIPPR